MSRLAFAARSIARSLEAAQGFGMLLEELCEVGEDFNRGGTEMMFNAFDVLALRFGIEAEEGEKARERDVPILNFARDLASLVGHDEAAIFFVLQISSFGELLDHARHGGLFHLERGGDIDDAGVTLLLDQFMDTLQIIFCALAGCRLGHVAKGLNKGLR